MNLQPVNSSRMKAVGWNNEIMYIQFNDGSIYAYLNTSKNQYLSFISSASLGKELINFQRFHSYHRV